MAAKEKKPHTSLEEEFRAAVSEIDAACQKGRDAVAAAQKEANEIANKYGIPYWDEPGYGGIGMIGEYELAEKWRELDEYLIGELTNGSYDPEYGWDYSSC